MSPSCPYCRGMRCRCNCETDCGARAEDRGGHVCAKAPVEVQREWLRSTGMYSDAELEAME